MKASEYEVLMETRPDGGEIWLTAEPEEITPEQEGRLIDDGRGWGRQFTTAVYQAIGWYGRWGWCTIKVTYSKEGREGAAYLGCCSYSGPEAFKVNGYYEQKVSEAYHNWCNPPRTGG